MRLSPLCLLPALALVAACGESADDNSLAINGMDDGMTADGTMDGTAGTTGSMDGMDGADGMNGDGTMSGTTGTTGSMGSDAPGSVSDGPMPGPDSGEANEGGTNPNDTDVGLDDSVDAEESY